LQWGISQRNKTTFVARTSPKTSSTASDLAAVLSDRGWPVDRRSQYDSPPDALNTPYLHAMGWIGLD
jgi:hypothetical protein